MLDSNSMKLRVLIPLLVMGGLLTLLGLSPLIGFLFVSSGLIPAPENFRPVGAISSAIFFLSVGLPALFSGIFYRRSFAARLSRIAGALIAIIFGISFPITLTMNLPFFIPLLFYAIAATGIWVVLQNK
ncbi:MAG: hypothetical protein H3C43_07830 [Leptonema sp. (in: Bacteria)]|nr:hypothetical protein [Leptonema sp. (in: bacteria)]